MHQLLHIGIFAVPAGEAVAIRNAAQILIDNRNRVEQRIEQNGVGGLLAYAGQRQQLAANHGGWLRGETGQRSTMLTVQKD